MEHIFCRWKIQGISCFIFQLTPPACHAAFILHFVAVSTYLQHMQACVKSLGYLYGNFGNTICGIMVPLMITLHRQSKVIIKARVTFIIAFLLLLTGAALNDQHGKGQTYFGDYCFVVKAGVFAGGAVLSLASVSLGITSMLLYHSPRAQSPGDYTTTKALPWGNHSAHHRVRSQFLCTKIHTTGSDFPDVLHHF